MLNLYEYQSKKSFSQKHLLTLQDYDIDEIYQILSLALRLKEKQKEHIPHRLLEGKTLAMIFTKSSTRTRVSFEVGIHQLGGHGLFLSDRDIQLKRGETIADTAKVLSRYVDGIMIRTFAQKDVEDLAKYGTIPIINGLTDTYHPCQILADLLTIYEHKGDFSKLKLAFIGDGNNVAHSLLIASSKIGMDISIACPKGYEPSKSIIDMAIKNAHESGCKVEVRNDIEKAAANADIIYTDVWASMGQENETKERLEAFSAYQINDCLTHLAKEDYIFMHCLPAHRGKEVTKSVIDGVHSVIFDQSENRLHTQKAVMTLLMGNNSLIVL